jgi:hypothetical protein
MAGKGTLSILSNRTDGVNATLRTMNEFASGIGNLFFDPIGGKVFPRRARVSIPMMIHCPCLFDVFNDYEIMNAVMGGAGQRCLRTVGSHTASQKHHQS